MPASQLPPSRSAARHNLFFAVFPDPEAASAIAGRARRWIASRQPAAHPIAAARLHVSLCQLGLYAEEPPDAVVSAARDAALCVRMPPFMVAFNALASFQGKAADRQPLVLLGDDGVAGLAMLRERLLDALGRRPAPYAPHMTLAYGANQPEQRLVEPITWHASELVLVHSLVGASRYRELARIALRS